MPGLGLLVYVCSQVTSKLSWVKFHCVHKSAQLTFAFNTSSIRYRIVCHAHSTGNYVGLMRDLIRAITGRLLAFSFQRMTDIYTRDPRKRIEKYKKKYFILSSSVDVIINLLVFWGELCWTKSPFYHVWINFDCFHFPRLFVASML